MSIPFAINGLGRIGRALLRIAAGRPDLRLVAVNDLASATELARLVSRDSIHGAFAGEVHAAGETLWVNDEAIAVLQEPEAAAVPWSKYGPRIVVETSGLNTRRCEAEKHLGGGVETVLISALAEDADYTLCLGVNESGYNAEHHRVISNASCTTNCLALLVQVLHERFGLRRALMNEVHGYAGNQRLLDGIHADPRRGRAAAVNIVPTTSGAPQAVAEMISGLGGRLSGQAVRVPTPAVALLDLVATFERPATAEAINQAFREAAAGDLASLLAVSEEPLVSTDYVGDSHSAVVDSLLTTSDGVELHRVMAWYDNEWGYAHRLADLLTLIGERLT